MHGNTPPATYNSNKRIEVREDSVEQKEKKDHGETGECKSAAHFSLLTPFNMASLIERKYMRWPLSI